MTGFRLSAHLAALATSAALLIFAGLPVGAAAAPADGRGITHDPASCSTATARALTPRVHIVDADTERGHVDGLGATTDDHRRGQHSGDARGVEAGNGSWSEASGAGTRLDGQNGTESVDNLRHLHLGPGPTVVETAPSGSAPGRPTGAAIIGSPPGGVAGASVGANAIPGGNRSPSVAPAAGPAVKASQGPGAPGAGSSRAPAAGGAATRPGVGAPAARSPGLQGPMPPDAATQAQPVARPGLGSGASMVLGPVPLLIPIMGDTMARTSSGLQWKWLGALGALNALLLLLIRRRRHLSL